MGVRNHQIRNVPSERNRQQLRGSRKVGSLGAISITEEWGSAEKGGHESGKERDNVRDKQKNNNSCCLLSPHWPGPMPTADRHHCISKPHRVTGIISTLFLDLAIEEFASSIQKRQRGDRL